MIGEPTNFVHMTHVGSGDMGMPAVSMTLPYFTAKDFFLCLRTVMFLCTATFVKYKILSNTFILNHDVSQF